MSDVKNVIFDIGNVLVDFHPIPYFQRLMPNHGMEKICPLIFDATWEKIDEGIYTCEQAKREHLNKYPQYQAEIEYIYANWKEMMDLNEATYAYLKECKLHHYQVFLLSNIGAESHCYLKDRYAFFDDVNGGVFSYLEHVIKPNQEIYLILLRRYHLKAEECIFFDDNIRNIQTACSLGMKGVHFMNFKQATHEAKLW